MPQLFNQLKEFLSEVENEKKASVRTKRATAHTEPGSQGGATSHPSKNVDDNTQPASEGARSQENSKDIKGSIFNGGVDAAGDSAPNQEDQQFGVGITSTSTGEDPSNEDNYKTDKEDPGTTHPAKTDDGEKYGSMSFGDLRKLAEHKANGLLADISTSLGQVQAKVNQSVAEQTKAAAYYGEQLAQPYQAQDIELAVKQAHDAVAEAIQSTITDGIEKAAMVGAYLSSFLKAAEGEVAAPEEETEAPSEGAEAEAGMDVDPAMMQQMAGEQASPEQAGGGQDAAVQELLMALQEQGIDPAELLAMIQQQGGGGGEEAPGGAPPMDPAMDPAMMGGVPPEAAKMASSVDPYFHNLIKYAYSYRRAGKFRFTEAKTAQQRNLRDQIKMCVREIING